MMLYPDMFCFFIWPIVAVIASVLHVWSQLLRCQYLPNITELLWHPIASSQRADTWQQIGSPIIVAKCFGEHVQGEEAVKKKYPRAHLHKEKMGIHADSRKKMIRYQGMNSTKTRGKSPRQGQEERE